MTFIDKGTPGCTGEVRFDTDTEPGVIITTCPDCTLDYRTPRT